MITILLKQFLYTGWEFTMPHPKSHRTRDLPSNFMCYLITFSSSMRHRKILKETTKFLHLLQNWHDDQRSLPLLLQIPQSDQLQTIGFKVNSLHTALPGKLHPFLARRCFHHVGINAMLMPSSLRPMTCTSVIMNHNSGTTLSGLLKKTAINITFYPLLRWCYSMHRLLLLCLLFTWMEDMP